MWERKRGIKCHADAVSVQIGSVVNFHANDNAPFSSLFDQNKFCRRSNFFLFRFIFLTCKIFFSQLSCFEKGRKRRSNDNLKKRRGLLAMRSQKKSSSPLLVSTAHHRGAVLDCGRRLRARDILYLVSKAAASERERSRLSVCSL